MSSRRLVTFFAAVVALGSCVRVTTSYRDVGVDSPSIDAPTIDAPRPDAPPVDAPIDAARPDTPPMDAPLPDTPLGDGADATRMVLRSVGENVILADLRRFSTEAAALEAALATAVASGSPADLDAARLAWRRAMYTWERIEAVQMGPAGLGAVTIGGRGLRDEIYAWPLIGTCSIDQNTASTAYETAASVGALPIHVRGLYAMEYLLFRADGGHDCGPTSAIQATWGTLGDAEVARRRLVYAHGAAVVVVEHAEELRLAWEPSGGDYLGIFSSAGLGSPRYPTAQAGLNGLSDALFYLYKEVCDLKLAIPAALRIECMAPICPELVESRWAGASLDHVRANVEAFRDAYLGAPMGTDAPGFDDLLRSVGQGDLDRRIQEAAAAALAGIDAVDGPLEDALVTDLPDVVQLYNLCRALADLFKIELTTILDLALPTSVEGDSD